MSVFLFVSLLTLLIFETLQLHPPARAIRLIRRNARPARLGHVLRQLRRLTGRRDLDGHGRKLPARVLVRRALIRGLLRRHMAYAVLSVVLSIIAVFLAGWAIFWAFYPPFGFPFFVTEVVLGKLLTPIMLGVAFGVLFGVLLNSFLLSSEEGKISTKGKALIALLLVILLLGAGGEQVLQEGARRVSKVSYAGAEISFAEPLRAQRGRQEGDPSATGFAFNSMSAYAPALPLEMFRDLPELIARDKAYVVAAIELRQSKSKAAIRGRGSPNTGAAAQSAAAKSNNLSGLDDAARVASTMIAPFGACELAMLEQSGDIEFVRNSLSILLPPLRDLASPTYEDADRFAAKAATALGRLYRELFVHAYDRFYPPVSTSAARHSQMRVARRPGTGCQALAYILCSSQPWEDTRADIEKAFGARPKKEPNPNAWMEKLNVSGGDARLKQCHDDALKGSQSPFELGVRDDLKKFAAKRDSLNRPYVSMLVAGIFAQLGQHEAALAQIDDWLTRQTDTSEEASWLQARALNAINIITENWIRREGANASIVLREFHISRLERALELTDKLFDLKAVMRKVTLQTAPSKAGFTRPPPDSDQCTDKWVGKADSDDLYPMSRLYYWYLTIYAYAAHHRLLHPEYAKYYSARAQEIVWDLLDTDLGCAFLWAPPQRALFRAETLRLYAFLQYQDALATRALKPKGALETQLTNGLTAADLGIRMVRRHADADREEKRKHDYSTDAARPPVLNRLAPTQAISLYESLLRVRAQLIEAQQQLD
jgi:hypothetical protein